MKLKNFHRLAALGLAVGMTTALAACGNTAETAESTAETAESTEAASSEAADAATDRRCRVRLPGRFQLFRRFRRERLSQGCDRHRLRHPA